MNFNEAKAKLEALGQSHLLRWYDELGDMEQEALLAQIDALDPSLLEVFAKYGADGEAQRGKLEPLGALTIGEIEEKQGGETSVNYFAGQTLRAARVPLSAFQTLQETYAEELPVISTQRLTAADGHELSGEEEEVSLTLQAYRKMQYYRMFDEFDE